MLQHLFTHHPRWVAKRDDDETTWEPARECHGARMWWTDREIELELAAAQQEAHRIEQLEALRGRGSGRTRKHARRSSPKPSLSDDSEDELDYARIEYGDDADAEGECVDELFESEQGMLLVS